MEICVGEGQSLWFITTLVPAYVPLLSTPRPPIPPHIPTAASLGKPVNHAALVREVAAVVRGAVLGTVTGAVVAPLAALVGAARLAARPFLLGLGAKVECRACARSG
jgi:hypothetical protein